MSVGGACCLVKLVVGLSSDVKEWLLLILMDGAASPR